MKDPISKNKNTQKVGNDVSNYMGAHHNKGDVTKPELGRTMGAATKDNRHGIHTDRSASRRTESRRDGSMGSESKPKSQRKNR
jgi:hypothetical protein